MMEKTEGSDRIRWWTLGLAIALLLMSLTMVTGTGRSMLRSVARCVRHNVSYSGSFNSAEWKNSSLAFAKPYPRKWMVKDLMSRYSLVGLRKTDVLSLLGNPDYTLPGIWQYFLYPDGGGDAMALEIEYDKRERVQVARIISN